MPKKKPDFEIEIVDENGNVLPEGQSLPMTDKEIDFIVKLFLPLILQGDKHDEIIKHNKK